MSSIASLVNERLAAHAERVVLRGNAACSREQWTAGELVAAVEEFAAGLTELGVDSGVHVGLVADNCDVWLVADLACLSLGAVDVPRAADTSVDEVAFILEHSECKVVLLEDVAQWERLRATLAKNDALGEVVVLKGESGEGYHTLDEVRARGRKLLEGDADLVKRKRDAVTEDDLATIVYTSGTTGNPKGVMLSHGNILHNVGVLPGLVDFRETDVYYSFLPTWHAFERTVEYCLLWAAATIAYGSKITFMKDLPRVKPTIMAGVPRVWEAIASGVTAKLAKAKGLQKTVLDFMLAGSTRYMKHFRRLQRIELDDDFRFVGAGLGSKIVCALNGFRHRFCEKKVYSKVHGLLGGRMRFVISGGGALPPHVDEFMHRAGVVLLNGYGLTETAPVVSVRLPDVNVLTTSGRPLPETSFRVMDEDGAKDLGPCTKGVLWIRGPQVMRGYFKNEAASSRVLSDGWFCSGDLAVLTEKDDVIICGRVKDTIVLRGGENVEPEVIEAQLSQSPLIGDCLVVGHTQKHLGALIVPNLEGLKEAHPHLDGEDLSRQPQVAEILHGEVARLLGRENGFRDFERVPKIVCLHEPFSIETGTLTPTMKKRRPVIEERFSGAITGLFEDGSPPHSPAP